MKITKDQQPAAPTEALRAEVTREEPKDLLGKVNKTLTETTGTSAHHETSPQELVDYLKTFKFPVGKLKAADAKIINNELVVNGLISVPFGEATFDVTLANDETGGIRVKRHDLVLSGSAGAARGKVEEYIANLNAKLATRINREINPAWETDKFSITADKLAIDFKQKPKTS